MLFLVPGSGRSDVGQKKTHRELHHPKKRFHYKNKYTKRKLKTERTGRPRPLNDSSKRHSELKLNMPSPGHDGEDFNDWFYRRRAFPNESIDPEFYPNALAQAAKMPMLLHPSSKNSTLETFTWQSIGPYSIDGRVTCIATHPTDSNTFYIGAATGGLWKTTDHGTIWKCVTDTFGMLPIGCVTIDREQPETVYIGQGECNSSGDSYPGNGLWKSSDGGNSWTYLGFAKTQYISKIVISPSDRNTIYMAALGPVTLSDSNRGVFKSTDGGETWTRSLFIRLSKIKTSASMGIIDLAIDPLNPLELVAFAWDHTSRPSGYSFGMCGPNTGIWKSNDSGHTWTRIDTVTGNGLPNGMNGKVFSRGALLWQADKTQSYLFAGFSRMDTNKITHQPFDVNFKALYRSTDDGVSWVKLVDSTLRIPMGGVQGKDSADIMNAQGMYNFYLAGNPLHPNEVYLGGIDIFRSTNYGTSFTDITTSYSTYYVKDNRGQHSDQHALAFTAATSGTDMIAGSDGGIFHTNDFGAHWDHVIGLPITQFYTITPWRAGMAATPARISSADLKIFGGTQDNGTVGHGLTSNPDFAWINAGDGAVAISHPTDSNKIITSLQEGVIFARNTLDSLVPLPLSMRDTTHDARPRWHTLTYKLLYGSMQRTDTMEACGFVAPVALDDNTATDLYTGRCHVYHAILDWIDLENTRWQTWSPMLAGDIPNDSIWGYGDLEAIAIGPRDNANHPMLWAGGWQSSGTALWRTVVDPSRQDTTAPEWIPITKGLPVANISQIVPDRSDSLTAFVTNSSASNVPHVLKTTDGGVTWTTISGNLPVAPVTALVIDTLAEQGNPLLKNQILFVGTDVGVYVTTNGGSSWLALGYGMPHIIVSDLKIYKNMLIAATHGRSLYAMDIADVRPGVFEVTQALNAHSVTIYPNPVLSGSRFSVHIDNSSAQSIRTCMLVDASSGRSYPVKIESEENNTYSIVTPTDVLPGAYFIQLIGPMGELFAQGKVLFAK
jgi:photosystem II stability/assembly factor-like uncharacterized protein